MTLQKQDRSVAVNNINNDLPGTTHEIVLDRKQVFKGGVAFILRYRLSIISSMMLFV